MNKVGEDCVSRLQEFDESIKLFLGRLLLRNQLRQAQRKYTKLKLVNPPAKSQGCEDKSCSLEIPINPASRDDLKRLQEPERGKSADNIIA